MPKTRQDITETARTQEPSSDENAADRGASRRSTPCAVETPSAEAGADGVLDPLWSRIEADASEAAALFERAFARLTGLSPNA